MSLAVLMLSAFQLQAQNQTKELSYQAKVYGMVCNQCAYGVEQALLHTDGIKDVYVNLKEGDVRAVLNPNKTVPADQIVQKIADQGITVRGLSGTLTGRIEQQNGTLYFVMGDARYELQSDEKNRSLEQYVGQNVTLSGQFKNVKGMDNAKSSQPAVFVATGTIS